MKWVTWENVGVDRIGCAWLILRHIDSKAKFHFIAKNSEVPADMEPFDIPGVKYSHHRGHCSFHAILHHHKLTDATLVRIARIVDEADTIQDVKIEPIAAGLDTLCEGIRLISNSDHQAIDRGLLIYDALYTRLKIA